MLLLVENNLGDKTLWPSTYEVPEGWSVLYEGVPPEPTENAVIITMRFSPDGPEYRYGAVRSTALRWYVTSPRGPRDATWPDLLAFMTMSGIQPTIQVPTGYATVEWPDSLANQEATS